MSNLESLTGQREQLKGVKQKMLSMANQLGMSQTVIRRGFYSIFITSRKISPYASFFIIIKVTFK